MLIFNLIIIFFPKEAVEGAKEGLVIWYNSALPALFPFAAALGLLAELNFTRLCGRLLSPVGRLLFGISAEGAFVLFCGITPGYPMGIALLCELYGSERISREEAVRLSAFCSNSGPLFILGSVGAVMLGSLHTALYILICHYLSAFILGAVLGIILPPLPKDTPKGIYLRENIPFGAALSHSVTSACSSMITIGGFIVLFSVVTRLLSMMGLMSLFTLPLRALGLEGEMSEGIVTGLFEITKGCAHIAKAHSPLVPPVICMLISFGGFSIHAQSVSLLSVRRLPVMPYILGKTASSLLAFILSLILMKSAALF